MEIQKSRLPRFMIVGTGSGSGKTTVTCAVMKAMQLRGNRVTGFKCGPDFIDPMFHSSVIGVKSRNLDIFLSGEEGVRFLLARSSQDADLSIIEGVMGMYDGVSMTSDEASSNHLARLTGTPEILVVEVGGMALSLAALIQGYLNFRPNLIKGIILNQCSEGLYAYYKDMIESQLGIRVYGYLPMVEEATIGSRHLGLVTADEIADLQTKIQKLAEAAERSIDLDGLTELAREAEVLEWTDLWQSVRKTSGNKIRIGVARDKAFCFFYQDNLDLLEALGAEIAFFSPLEDSALPEDLQGLILYGGYPELYGEQLSHNTSMLDSVRTAVQNHLPTLAECGGFMYLLETMVDAEGQRHAMVGAIEGESKMLNHLIRFGYAKMKALKDNLLCEAGAEVPVHEFHYSDSDHNGEGFFVEKKQRSWHCVNLTETLFAGYPHLHYGSRPELMVRFLEACKGKK
ncbi:MAG: cobyrinate a,c-diamide synthase [Acidaminobacter sp.]|uniref:cobyrinate a,c-diamide synthase n=1 Tax=Acidaminobacter sp. TaxID=1872102 RepID=UPI0013824F81|nr:cobyrinate a,c-diamide synthase [Acidaminobacter sp.]MZQ98235.1 cobyrinate a,c-diamide synthase [Acidaminobacter sp.]